MVDLIISGIVIVLITIYKIILNKKYKITNETKLYISIKKQNKILYIISIIIFITTFIFIYVIYGFNKDTLYIPLTISIISLPLIDIELYKKYFTDEEQYAHIKRIITKLKPSKELENKFKKAGILITDDKDKNTNDCETIECKKDLEKLYNNIMISRSLNDKYTNTIEYNYRLLTPLAITYLLLTFIEFPFEYYLSFILIIKLLMILSSNYIYMKIPFDKDVETRKPKPLNIFIERQEILFLLIEILSITFTICIIYMYLLLINAQMNLLNGIFITIYLYSIIFTTIVHYSENAFIKNIIKIIKNIRLIIFIIILIIFTILINYITIFDTINMGLRNYFAALFLALLFSLPYELIKLARYTTVKGVKKNGKNNKKHKRSKSNNS